MEQPYASIARWAVLECQEPGKASARHLVDYIVGHDRLNSMGENLGEPYIGSALSALDVVAREARNAPGKLISLSGDAMPGADIRDLPRAIKTMLDRAGLAWQLEDPVWKRVA